MAACVVQHHLYDYTAYAPVLLAIKTNVVCWHVE